MELPWNGADVFGEVGELENMFKRRACVVPDI